MIEPILTYGCEVSGYENLTIERKIKGQFIKNQGNSVFNSPKATTYRIFKTEIGFES